MINCVQAISRKIS